MFWGRILLYLDSFRIFGAMLVILKQMFQETFIFFALLIVIMVGFLQAFMGLDNTDAEEAPPMTSFILRTMANAVLQSPEFESFDKFSPPFGMILYYVFTFVIMVLLLNILIALFNSAYEDITGNSTDEFMALVSTIYSIMDSLGYMLTNFLYSLLKRRCSSSEHRMRMSLCLVRQQIRDEHEPA